MCRGNATFRRFAKRLGDGRNAGMRVKTNNIILPHTGVLQHAYARIILLLSHIGGYQNAYTRTIDFFFFSHAYRRFGQRLCATCTLAFCRNAGKQKIIFYYTAHRRFTKRLCAVL